MKRFELADENTKILKAHTCEECNSILYEAYECKENRCTIFCKDHLPENKKCEICDGEFMFNQNLTDNIKNRYKVKCLNCPSKMMLKDFDSHLEEGCKKECSQKCGQLFSTEEEMEKHIKEECIETVIKCIACSYANKRGEVNIHQEICEEMQKIKQINLNLEKKIEQQDKEIFLLKEENQKQGEEISFLKKYVEEQKKKLELEEERKKRKEEKKKKKEQFEEGERIGEKREIEKRKKKEEIKKWKGIYQQLINKFFFFFKKFFLFRNGKFWSSFAFERNFERFFERTQIFFSFLFVRCQPRRFWCQ